MFRVGLVLSLPVRPRRVLRLGIGFTGCMIRLLRIVWRIWKLLEFMRAMVLVG